MAQDIVTLLVASMQERYPDIDVRPGTVVRDWIINPVSVMLEPYQEQLAALAASQSLGQYDTLDEAAMDALAANLFVPRDLGVRPRTEIILGFDRPVSVSVSQGDIVQNGEGDKQYEVRQDFSATAQALAARQGSDGLFYTNSIAVEAVNPGSDQEVDANELVSMPFGPTGLIRVTNPLRSRWGADAETNAVFHQRLGNALSTRQLLNEPGVRYQLLTQFRHLREVMLVGAGHPLMERDETYVRQDEAAVVLPVSNFYGKVAGDRTNRNKAFKLSSTDAVPARTDFVEEVSNTEYRWLGSASDANLAVLATGTLFEDDFSARPAFVPADSLLTQDADTATDSIVLEETVGFAPGDRVDLTSSMQTTPLERTVLAVNDGVLTLSDTVSGLTTADEVVCTKKVRDYTVGNGWIESTHDETIGEEKDGRACLLLGRGGLRLGAASYATDRALRSTYRASSSPTFEARVQNMFKKVLRDSGFNPTDGDTPNGAEAINDEVDALPLYVERQVQGAGTFITHTEVTVQNDTEGFAESGTAYINNSPFQYGGLSNTRRAELRAVVAAAQENATEATAASDAADVAAAAASDAADALDAVVATERSQLAIDQAADDQAAQALDRRGDGRRRRPNRRRPRRGGRRGRFGGGYRRGYRRRHTGGSQRSDRGGGSGEGYKQRP